MKIVTWALVVYYLGASHPVTEPPPAMRFLDKSQCEEVRKLVDAELRPYHRTMCLPVRAEPSNN